MSLKIAGAEIWNADLRLRQPYRIAGELITAADNAFILFSDDSGHTGIGCAYPMPEVCGESLSACLTALMLGKEIILANPRLSLEKLCTLLDQNLRYTPAARAAIDIALLDLHCKVLDTPLWKYLGGHLRSFETSVTIGIVDITQALEEMQAHLRNGFRIIKVKIGDQVDQDIELLHKLRAAGSSGIILRVDANEGYEPGDFNKFLQHTRDLNLEIIEQPFAAPGIGKMLLLPESQRAICMADEDLITEEDADALVQSRAYGIWNIKLMKSGGVTPSIRIAQKAAQHGFDVMWGCNDESRISISAALHAACASSATKYIDLDGAFDIMTDVVSGGFTISDGQLRLTDQPGLGVTLIV